MHLQIAQEQVAEQVASHYSGKTLILLDRGLLDAAAYVEAHILEDLLAQHNLSRAWILASRYDGVVHMVSAADWAEAYYTLANNESRTESIEQAKQLDYALRGIYASTSGLRIIDNSTSFEEKLQRVEAAIFDILGIPESLR